MAKNLAYLRPGDPLPQQGNIAEVAFDSGTVVVRGLGREDAVTAGFVWDPRVGLGRAPAIQYRAVVGALVAAGLTVVDAARAYDDTDISFARRFSPFEHQAEAVAAWLRGRRGTVVLPTGSGKSFVAELAIEQVRRPTLVVAPTLDLVDQWVRRLSKAFDVEVGALGGGRHDVRDLTVSTYDSAAIHMDRLGDRFGFVVFDEVHHLPGDLYRQAAEAMIAPFRLGLTATLEREDGRHRAIEDLVGPVVYRKGIKDLSGDILADYVTETIVVEMSDRDREEYERHHAIYRGFIDDNGIRLGGRHGWKNFLRETSRSPEGRAAHASYRTQRRIALAHQRKIEALEQLLRQHWDDQTIIFANDNATVYQLAERYLLPAITHQTPLKERSEILQRFADGDYRVVVTSRVLNEGVDVPAAGVAIVLSGTGTVREHVQRLGRILRRLEGKRAVLYELVTADTVERHISARRREHDAYR